MLKVYSQRHAQYALQQPKSKVLQALNRYHLAGVATTKLPQTDRWIRCSRVEKEQQTIGYLAWVWGCAGGVTTRIHGGGGGGG